jgi:hypothetical protein
MEALARAQASGMPQAMPDVRLAPPRRGPTGQGGNINAMMVLRVALKRCV